jgi:hypothetical protein
MYEQYGARCLSERRTAYVSGRNTMSMINMENIKIAVIYLYQRTLANIFLQSSRSLDEIRSNKF